MSILSLQDGTPSSHKKIANHRFTIRTQVIPICLQAYTFVVAASLQDASLSLSSTYCPVRPGTRVRVGLLAAASVCILNTKWYKSCQRKTKMRIGFGRRGRLPVWKRHCGPARNRRSAFTGVAFIGVGLFYQSLHVTHVLVARIPRIDMIGLKQAG
jgi:hypothetical protein